jgi:hypothetical protein
VARERDVLRRPRLRQCSCDQTRMGQYARRPPRKDMPHLVCRIPGEISSWRMGCRPKFSNSPRQLIRCSKPWGRRYALLTSQTIMQIINIVPSNPYPNMVVSCLPTSAALKCGVEFYCKPAHRTMSVQFRTLTTFWAFFIDVISAWRWVRNRCQQTNRFRQRPCNRFRSASALSARTSNGVTAQQAGIS